MKIEFDTDSLSDLESLQLLIHNRIQDIKRRDEENRRQFEELDRKFSSQYHGIPIPDIDPLADLKAYKKKVAEERGRRKVTKYKTDLLGLSDDYNDPAVDSDE